MKSDDGIGAVIAAFLGIAGLFGLVVGGHDVALPDEPFSVQVVGALFLATGVLAVVGSLALGAAAFHLAPMREWSGRTAMSACLAVSAIAVFFVVAELASFQTNPRVLVWAALVGVVGIVSLCFLLLTTGVTLGTFGPVLIGLVGTAFAAFQFWFAQQYLPTREPAALQATATLEPVGAVTSGLHAYRATLVLENVGKTKAIALAGGYNISATAIPRRDAAATPRDVLKPFLSQATDPYAARFSRHAGLGPAPEIIQAGKLFAENRYFEPGEQLTRRFIVFVPPCEYSLLRVRAHSVVAKGTLIRMGDRVAGYGTFDDKGSRGERRFGVYARWAIKDDSWVHDILEGKEHAILVNYVGSASRFDVSLFRVTAWLLKGTGRRSPVSTAEYTRRARERLGLANSFADDELALIPKASGSAAPSC